MDEDQFNNDGNFFIDGSKYVGGSGFDSCSFSNTEITSNPIIKEKKSTNPLGDAVNSLKETRVFSVELWHTAKDISTLVDFNVKNGLTLKEAQVEKQLLLKKYSAKDGYNVLIKVNILD